MTFTGKPVSKGEPNKICHELSSYAECCYRYPLEYPVKFTAFSAHSNIFQLLGEFLGSCAIRSQNYTFGRILECFFQ